MSTVEGTVEFGAELTFETERGCASIATTEAPDVRTAPKLTLAVTDVHQKTPDDVFGLLDQVLDDRTGLFASVTIDVSDAASTSGFVGTLCEYVAASDWDGAVHIDSIDSYYDYDPDRLLVTPERYICTHPADTDAPTDEVDEMAAEATEST